MKTKSVQKKILDDSFKIIYDEITQNLCLAKLSLSICEENEPKHLKEKIKKSHDLISKSIQQLRIVGEMIIKLKKNIPPEEK